MELRLLNMVKVNVSIKLIIFPDNYKNLLPFNGT